VKPFAAVFVTVDVADCPAFMPWSVQSNQFNPRRNGGEAIAAICLGEAS